MMKRSTKRQSIQQYLDLFGYAKTKRRRKSGPVIPLWLPAGMSAAAGLIAYRSVTRKRLADFFNGRSVVIAGGSRGLGLVIARMLAAEGARLTLLAREPEELERAEAELTAMNAEVSTWPCDTRSREQVEQALGRVVRQYGRIDVLINLEGIIQVGPFEHMTTEDFRDAMDTHFWGPLYTITSVHHYMKQQGGGRIVNVSSIAGKVAVPRLAPYVASKFALTGLSDSLRAELAKDNIQVTTVIPGLMRTGSHVNALFKGRHREEFTWFSIMDSLPITSTSAESAARKIVEACRRGKPHLTITPQARFLEIASSLAPGLTARGMTLMNRILPKPADIEDTTALPGWESQSQLSPSKLTQLADEQIGVNNQAVGIENAVERGER